MDFRDTPEEAMAEVYYLDQGRLLLTHYCEARNQPTLVASAISEDGNTIEFTFLHGTGMPSRDTGHMDKMVLYLSGTDTYASQWTWYAKGKENWMERIESRRAPDKTSSSSAGQTP